MPIYLHIKAIQFQSALPFSTTAIGSFFILLVVLSIIVFIICSRKRLRSSHSWRIRKSKIVIRTLKKIQAEHGPAYQFGYLRSRGVDPFVFEECILTSFENSNIKVYRNARYTGDGGVDGAIKWKGNKILIQAKLYSGYINPKDVHAFRELCLASGCFGLFIHTGKTGPKSRINTNNSIEIVSGMKMLAFLSGESVTFFESSIAVKALKSP